MASLSVFSLRLLLPAWIGAAVLFVITSVAEQTSPNFDSMVRDQLATIRFPLYYLFGFAVHVGSVLFAIVLWSKTDQVNKRRTLGILVFITLSFVVLTLDYVWVYRPLESLVTPPGQARTTEFIRLHTLSRHANETHLILSFIAALLVALPQRMSPDSVHQPSTD